MPNPLLPSGGTNEPRRRGPPPSGGCSARCSPGAGAGVSALAGRPARSRTASSRGWSAAGRSPKSRSATRSIRGQLKKADGPTDVHDHAHRGSEAGRGARSARREVLGRSRQPLAARGPQLARAGAAARRALVVLLPPHRRRRRRRDVVRAQQGEDLRRRRRQGELCRCGGRRRSGAGAARDRRVPEDPEEVHEPRRQDSQGRAAGRPAGHRQDAAGARRRGRSQGARSSA